MVPALGLDITARIVKLVPGHTSVTLSVTGRAHFIAPQTMRQNSFQLSSAAKLPSRLVHI